MIAIAFKYRSHNDPQQQQHPTALALSVTIKCTPLVHDTDDDGDHEVEVWAESFVLQVPVKIDG